MSRKRKSDPDVDIRTPYSEECDRILLQAQAIRDARRASVFKSPRTAEGSLLGSTGLEHANIQGASNASSGGRAHETHQETCQDTDRGSFVYPTPEGSHIDRSFTQDSGIALTDLNNLEWDNHAPQGIENLAELSQHDIHSLTDVSEAFNTGYMQNPDVSTWFYLRTLSDTQNIPFESLDPHASLAAFHGVPNYPNALAMDEDIHGTVPLSVVTMAVF